jgi:probable rRNA maturation factor
MAASIAFSAHEPFEHLPLGHWMTRLAGAVLDSQGIAEGELSILVTDDETVQRLNREYRGYDQPTDVLSFGLSDLSRPATDDQEPEAIDFPLPPDTPLQLGEVVIAYPTAKRQAAEHGRDTPMELAHLLIHGVLHLLGFDHFEPDEEREMRLREESLLLTRIWEDV